MKKTVEGRIEWTIGVMRVDIKQEIKAKAQKETIVEIPTETTG